jgi:hypothetical protein
MLFPMVPPEHKDAASPDQRERLRSIYLLSQGRDWNGKSTCGGKQAIVVARQFDRIALRPQKFACRKVQ